MSTEPKARAGKLDPVKEALAVKSLKESIAAAYPGDEDLLNDVIEGETNFFELLDILLTRMTENRGLADGVAKMIDLLKGRMERFERSIATDRALIEQALMIADVNTVPRPAGTLSLSKRPPKLDITEEADIPADYWKAGDPVLDKKALQAALAEREAALEALPDDGEARAAAIAALPPEIPGAVLLKCAPTLTIRVR